MKPYRLDVEQREKTLISLKSELNEQNSRLIDSGKALTTLDVKGLEALSDLEPTPRELSGAEPVEVVFRTSL